MEDIFLLPKAKAPVIFKVKTASALEFHIQFGVQKSRRPSVKESRGQPKSGALK